MSKNYYDILGIKRDASKDEIKRAFHKLAHKYHPDKQSGDEAKFKEVNEAYQVLSNEEKRRQYDAFGSADVGAGGFDSSGFAGFDFSSAMGGFDFGDIFSDFFGGAAREARGRKRRGRDISVDIAISFAESVFGTERKVLINKVGLCSACGGSGGQPGSKLKKCGTCNGQGRIRETRRSFLGEFTTVRECPACRGLGEVPETKCGACGGAGVTTRAEEIKIVIPPGIDDGEMIRLANQGEAEARGIPGDLYVRVRVEKHRGLRREGNDLKMTLTVKLSDALLGAEYRVETLDGTIPVNIPAGIGHGEMIRVRGKGVPYRPGKRGDLLLTIQLKMPAKLSRQAREAIERLREEGI